MTTQAKGSTIEVAVFFHGIIMPESSSIG